MLARLYVHAHTDAKNAAKQPNRTRTWTGERTRIEGEREREREREKTSRDEKEERGAGETEYPGPKKQSVGLWPRNNRPAPLN